MRKALFLICGLFALSTLGAQNANKKTSIGVGISFVDFSGPITEQYFMFDRHKGALNLSISRYLSKTFDVRASLTYGDVWHPNVVGYPNIIEGIYQPASMWDLGFNAMLKFNNGSLIKENARFAPYLLTGIGFNMINGIGNVGVNDDYNAYVPLGVGVNVRLNETFSLGLDGIYKFNVDNSFNYTQSTLKLLTNFGKSKSKEEKAAEATKTEATSAKAVEASTAPATSVNDSFCDHTWSIYAGMGFVDFQTPLTGQPFMFDRYKAVLNIGVQKYLSKFFDLRLGYSYGNVWHPFVTNYPKVENKRMVAATMHEIGLNLLYKLNNGKILNENAIFAPYVFTGVDPNYISGIGDQGVYDDFNVNIPVGVGFNFRTSNRFALAIEGAYKFNVDNSYGFTQAGIKGIYSLGKCRNGSAPAPAAAAAPKVDDADNDGIPDLTDECPFVAGKAEFFGCPDSDGDGIGDSRDKCPFEAGIAQNQGCKGVNSVFEEGTGDTDNDGIADNDDLCPDEAGPASNNGCPAAGMEVKTSEASENNNTSTNTTTDNSAVNNNNTTAKSGTDKNSNASKGAAAKSNNGKESVKLSPSAEQNVGQKLVTTYTIAFSSGCSMSPGQIESLQKIASMLRNNPNYTVKINGHTAAGGKSESNMDMSVCRAEKVLGSLKMKGVDVKRTRLTGYGDSRPTGLGAEKDNRVEVEVYVFE